MGSSNRTTKKIVDIAPKRKPGEPFNTIPSTEVSRAMAKSYAAARSNIQLRRQIRLDDRFWDTRQKPHPVKVRAGLPKRRERDASLPSKRGVPHSKFLKRFKIVDHNTRTILGDIVYGARVWVLHATRGWKLYA